MHGALGCGRYLRVILVVLALPLPGLAQAPAAGGGWTFAVEPYLWAAGVDGTLRYELPPGDGASATEIGLSLEDLSFAFMLTGEARKGDWAVVADFLYLDMESEAGAVKSVEFSEPGATVTVDATVDAGTTTDLVGTEWQLAGSYTLARGGVSSLDLVGGVRYLTIQATTAWRLATEIPGPEAGQVLERTGNVSKRVEQWDGVVGIRGALGLGTGRWTLPFYLDVGTGSTELTWQAVAGVAYRFAWGDLHLAYRWLTYDIGDEKLLQRVTFSGAGLGARLRF